MEHFKIVETAFFKELDDVFGAKPDIISFLKSHERIPLMLNNLKSEIVTTEIKKAHLINAESLKMIGKEFARTFAGLALKSKEHELMSEAELQRRRHEAHQWDEIGEMITEGNEITESLENGKIKTEI